jgi:hypothetical protein
MAISAFKIIWGVASFEAGEAVRVCMTDGYTSNEFQEVRKALLACKDADRAFLRRWILRWVDDHGHIKGDPKELAAKGC